MLKKKSMIINGVVAGILTALAVYYLASAKIITAENLALIPWYAFFVVLGYFFLSVLTLSAVDFTVYRTFTRDMPFIKCVKNTVSGHLGSSITPYRVGHFPLMAYYQNRDGVRLTDTATGLIKCQIVYSITSIIVYTVLVITLAVRGDAVLFYGKTVLLWSVILLGLSFHAGAFLLTVFLAFNLPLQNFVLKLSAKTIEKFKKNFDKEKFLQEKTAKLAIYKRQIGLIGKKFYYYFLPCFLYAVYMFVLGAIKFICYLLISGETFSVFGFFTFYVLSLASEYITNVVPVPGGAGASEVVFTYIFERVIPSAILGSVLVLWRSSTFYFAVIIEIIWFIVFTVVKTVKRSPKPESADPNG